MQINNTLATLIVISTTLLFGCNTSQVQASKWNETNSCWSPKQNAGTYDSSSACATATVIVQDDNGHYWQFSDLCIPDGYTIVNSQIPDELLSAKPCDAAPFTIQIQAHPWNATDSCWNPAQNAGTYTPTDAGCDTAHTLAKDTDGNLWLFPDSCIPDGYTLVDNQENIEAYSAEPCFN